MCRDNATFLALKVRSTSTSAQWSRARSRTPSAHSRPVRTLPIDPPLFHRANARFEIRGRGRQLRSSRENGRTTVPSGQGHGAFFTGSGNARRVTPETAHSEIVNCRKGRQEMAVCWSHEPGWGRTVSGLDRESVHTRTERAVGRKPTPRAKCGPSGLGRSRINLRKRRS